MGGRKLRACRPIAFDLMPTQDRHSTIEPTRVEPNVLGWRLPPAAVPARQHRDVHAPHLFTAHDLVSPPAVKAGSGVMRRHDLANGWPALGEHRPDTPVYTAPPRYIQEEKK